MGLAVGAGDGRLEGSGQLADRCTAGRSTSAHLVSVENKINWSAGNESSYFICSYLIPL